MTKKALFIYHNNKLLINAALSVCQVIVFACTYFILYSILLKTLGPAKLGVWALILSTSSVANIANLGLTYSVVNFTAIYAVENNSLKINKLIKTGLISIGIFMGIIAVIVYFVGYYTLPSFIPANELTVGLILLPLSLTSLWLNNVGGIILATIDGFQYTSLRSLIYIISSLLFLTLSYVLLPQYGLIGVAMAQITQALSVFILAGIGLKIIFNEFSLFPFFWDRATFKQIFKSSANFQIIGLLQLFYDPTTKFLLSKFGGLSFVGFYEMASRLVVQVRSLIVSANQVIVPTVASKAELSKENRQDSFYPRVLNLAIIIIFPLTASFIIFAPYISYYWIGHYEPLFIYSLIIIATGYFLNTLCVPSYFSSIGLGALKGILHAHIIMAVMNGLLGYSLGYFFGGWGVVISFALMLMTGATIMMLYYHQQQKIRFKDVIKKDFYKVISYSLLIASIGFLFYWIGSAHVSAPYLFGFSLLVFILYLRIILKNNTDFNLLTDRFKAAMYKIF